MRTAMRKILGGDYDVVEAEHGEDAWTLLLNDPSIQVVFTDLSMPYLDGYGLLERIRSADDEHVRELPVIIITGKEDDESAKQEAFNKGATDFISKPFESVQLKARAQAHARYEETTRKLNEISMVLERQAAVDEVTGLGGQRYFCKAANERLAFIRRRGGRIILLRLDVDGFDQIFIKNGKSVAHVILRQIGEYMSKTVRTEDSAARIGLAKFAMVLNYTQMQEAIDLAERLRSHIEEMSFKIGKKTLQVTASIGLLQPEITEDDDIKKLIEETETYLDKAINAGGNRICAANPDQLIDDMDIQTALNLVNKGEFDKVRPYANAILTRLHPLLEFLTKST